MNELRRLLAQILAGWSANVWPWENSDDRRVKLAFAELFIEIGVSVKSQIDRARSNRK